MNSLEFKPAVVEHNNQIFLCYGITHLAKAKLMFPNLDKYSGTPMYSRLKVLKTFETKTHNHTEYFLTKQGVISCASGNVMVGPDIVNLFK